jgi:hypothetical protein
MSALRSAKLGQISTRGLGGASTDVQVAIAEATLAISCGDTLLGRLNPLIPAPALRLGVPSWLSGTVGVQLTNAARLASARRSIVKNEYLAGWRMLATRIGSSTPLSSAAEP